MVTKENTETTMTTVTLVEGDDEKAYYVSAVFCPCCAETVHVEHNRSECFVGSLIELGHGRQRDCSWFTWPRRGLFSSCGEEGC